MWIYHIHFATVLKKSTLRCISHKFIVLTIIQCKEVPSLRFKLLAFLALVAHAVLPLRQWGTQKSTTSLLLTESHSENEFCSHGIFVPREEGPHSRSNQEFLMKQVKMWIKAPVSYSSMGDPIILLFSAGCPVYVSLSCKKSAAEHDPGSLSPERDCSHGLFSEDTDGGCTSRSSPEAAKWSCPLLWSRG